MGRDCKLRIEKCKLQNLELRIISINLQICNSQFAIPNRSLARAVFFAIIPATYPPLNPASIFTTLTFEAQLFNIPNSAASPPKAAP